MATGRIFQINISPGGVPKQAVPKADATPDGITDDTQRDRKHHGGPDRALCLYGLERILDLQAEGHPVFPGATGENLTLSGIDWDEVAPGRRLRLGRAVVIEIVSFTTPCATIKSFFRDDKPGRISQKHHPGWSRVYARVLEPGRLAVGDAVEMLDD